MLTETAYPKNFWIYLLLITVAAAAFCVFFGVDKSIWLDEAYSVYLAKKDFVDIVQELKVDAGPPLYYFMLSTWVRIFGISELAVRSLSITYYLLSIIGIYYLAKMIYKKPQTALIAVNLYALSSLAFLHAQNVRGYTLLSLLTILSTYYFFQIFIYKEYSHIRLLIYILVNTCGLFTHYWFFFVLMSQGIVELIYISKDGIKLFFISSILSWLPFIIIWLPIFRGQIKLKHTDWMGVPHLSDLFNSFMGFYSFIGFEYIAWIIFGIFCLLVLINIENKRPKIVAFNELKEFFKTKENIILTIFSTISILVPFIISQSKPMYLVNRSTIIILSSSVILLAGLFDKFANKRLLLIFCLLLSLTMPLIVWKLRTDPSRKIYGDKPTGQFLVSKGMPGDIIIYTSLSRVAIDYYLDLLKCDYFTKYSFPGEINSHLGWRNLSDFKDKNQQLISESNQILSEINQTSDKNTRVWLFYGYDAEISHQIKDDLDRQWILEATLDLKGSFFNRVLIYKKNVK